MNTPRSGKCTAQRKLPIQSQSYMLVNTMLNANCPQSFAKSSTIPNYFIESENSVTFQLTIQSQSYMLVNTMLNANCPQSFAKSTTIPNYLTESENSVTFSL